MKNGIFFGLLSICYTLNSNANEVEFNGKKFFFIEENTAVHRPFYADPDLSDKKIAELARANHKDAIRDLFGADKSCSKEAIDKVGALLNNPNSELSKSIDLLGKRGAKLDKIRVSTIVIYPNQNPSFLLCGIDGRGFCGGFSGVTGTDSKIARIVFSPLLKFDLEVPVYLMAKVSRDNFNRSIVTFDCASENIAQQLEERAKGQNRDSIERIQQEHDSDSVKSRDFINNLNSNAN